MSSDAGSTQRTCHTYRSSRGTAARAKCDKNRCFSRPSTTVRSDIVEWQPEMTAECEWAHIEKQHPGVLTHAIQYTLLVCAVFKSRYIMWTNANKMIILSLWKSIRASILPCCNSSWNNMAAVPGYNPVSPKIWAKVNVWIKRMKVKNQTCFLNHLQGVQERWRVAFSADGSEDQVILCGFWKVELGRCTHVLY